METGKLGSWFDDTARKLAGAQDSSARRRDGEPRAGRRRFVKGAAAVTAGLGAAAYVKPSLEAFGIPVALAVSGPEAVVAVAQASSVASASTTAASAIAAPSAAAVSSTTSAPSSATGAGNAAARPADLCPGPVTCGGPQPSGAGSPCPTLPNALCTCVSTPDGTRCADVSTVNSQCDTLHFCTSSADCSRFAAPGETWVCATNVECTAFCGAQLASADCTPGNRLGSLCSNQCVKMCG